MNHFYGELPRSADASDRFEAMREGGGGAEPAAARRDATDLANATRPTATQTAVATAAAIPRWRRHPSPPRLRRPRRLRRSRSRSWSDEMLFEELLLDCSPSCCRRASASPSSSSPTGSTEAPPGATGDQVPCAASLRSHNARFRRGSTDDARRKTISRRVPCVVTLVCCGSDRLFRLMKDPTCSTILSFVLSCARPHDARRRRTGAVSRIPRKK